MQTKGPRYECGGLSRMMGTLIGGGHAGTPQLSERNRDESGEHHVEGESSRQLLVGGGCEQATDIEESNGLATPEAACAGDGADDSVDQGGYLSYLRGTPSASARSPGDTSAESFPKPMPVR